MQLTSSRKRPNHSIIFVGPFNVPNPDADTEPNSDDDEYIPESDSDSDSDSGDTVPNFVPVSRKRPKTSRKRILTLAERRKLFKKLYEKYNWLALNDIGRIEIRKVANDLYDLIDIADIFDSRFAYDNLNVEKLSTIKQEMINLQKVIGNKQIKKSICEQIKYFIMDPTAGRDFAHAIIVGPPGVGKTMIAEHIGVLLSKLRKPTNQTPNVIIARKDDLVGQYVGHTAVKVKKMFEKAKNGVLIIDEAYSLGVYSHDDNSSEFNKECIDMMNQLLSEMKDEIIVILLGYKNEIEERLFSYNKGMARRFPFKFEMVEYSVDELWQIFEHMAHKEEWEIRNGAEGPFKSFAKTFKNNGGDCLTLFSKCKIAAVSVQFGRTLYMQREIDNETMNLAIERFKNESFAGKVEKPSENWKSMYT
jgi:broad-specificity NMP kinase